jgi:hypothetical protein
MSRQFLFFGFVYNINVFPQKHFDRSGVTETELAESLILKSNLTLELGLHISRASTSELRL